MLGTTKKNLSVLLGNAIMKRRQRKGLTQVKLAELLGIEQHSLSRMEKGIIAPKMSRLQEIADYLECSVAELFRQTDTPSHAKAQEICLMLDELPPEMQDVVLNLVENTVRSLKKLNKANDS